MNSMKRNTDRKGSSLPVLKTPIDNSSLKLKKSPKSVIEKLEKLLEEQSKKNKNLEESLVKSLNEVSVKTGLISEQRQQAQEFRSKIKDLEQELDVKEDLLKKKTSDLSKASEKHYQLEQELAFFKIDSKFEALGHRPRFEYNNDGDTFDESTYIGKARYRSNQYAQDTPIPSPQSQRIQLHSVTPAITDTIAPAVSVVAVENHVTMQSNKAQIHSATDGGTDPEVNKKIKALMDDLEWTEKKLKRATAELQKMTKIQEKKNLQSDDKFNLRQKLAQKMSNVTKLRDMATQVESEIDRKQSKIAEAKKQLELIQKKSNNTDNNKKSTLMLDKEQQISESNEVYNHLKAELQDMMENIQKETQDIRKIEEQLREEQIEKNEEITQDLDEAVNGLNVYLQNMQTQAEQMQKLNDNITREKMILENKVKQLEKDLNVLELEQSEMKKVVPESNTGFKLFNRKNKILPEQTKSNQSNKTLEKSHMVNGGDIRNHSNISDKSLMELENLLRTTQGKNQELSAQLVRGQSRIKQLIEKLEAAETNNRDLLKALSQKENQQQEQKISESETGFKPYNRINGNLPDPNRLNASYKPLEKPEVDPRNKPIISDKSLMELENLLRVTQGKNQELSAQLVRGQSRIKQLIENMESAETKNRSLLNILSEKENKSQKDDLEIRKLHDEITRLQNAFRNAEEKAWQKFDEEKRRLYDEISRLQDDLMLAEEKLRHSYSRSASVQDGSQVSVASSLYSDEQELYDELQRELMELKQYLRDKAQQEGSIFRNESRLRDVVDGGNSIQDSDFLHHSQDNVDYSNLRNNLQQSNRAYDNPDNERVERNSTRRMSRMSRKPSSQLSVQSPYRPSAANNIQRSMLPPGDETSHMLSASAVNSPAVSKHSQKLTGQPARNTPSEHVTAPIQSDHDRRSEPVVERTSARRVEGRRESEHANIPPNEQNIVPRISSAHRLPNQMLADQSQETRYIKSSPHARKQADDQISASNQKFNPEIVGTEPIYGPDERDIENVPNWRPTRPNSYKHNSEAMYPVSDPRNKKHHDANAYEQDINRYNKQSNGRYPDSVSAWQNSYPKEYPPYERENMHRKDERPINLPSRERYTHPVSHWSSPNPNESKSFQREDIHRKEEHLPSSRERYQHPVSAWHPPHPSRNTQHPGYFVSDHDKQHYMEPSYEKLSSRSVKHPINVSYSFDAASDSTFRPERLSRRPVYLHGPNPSHAGNYVLRRKSQSERKPPSFITKHYNKQTYPTAGEMYMSKKHGKKRTLSIPSRRIRTIPHETFSAASTIKDRVRHAPYGMQEHSLRERTKHFYEPGSVPLRNKLKRKVKVDKDVQCRSLFCNVKEHFQLEDFINDLQKKIKYLSTRRSQK